MICELILMYANVNIKFISNTMKIADFLFFFSCEHSTWFLFNSIFCLILNDIHGEVTCFLKSSPLNINSVCL